MGFRLDRAYDLHFEGALEGLEIKIRSTSVETVLLMQELVVASRDMAQLLADHVLEWNVEGKDGEPIPVTVGAVLGLEAPVLRAIVDAWYKAATGVSAPLDQPSTDGGPSVEDSMPMASL